MQTQEAQERLNRLITEFGELFGKYDFFISDKISDDAYKAIDIGGGKYIVFTHKDIKEVMEDKMKEYINEQNERIRRGEKPFEDIE